MVCNMLHVLEGWTLVCFWYDVSCTVSILPVLDEMSHEGTSIGLICGIYVSLCPVYKMSHFRIFVSEWETLFFCPGSASWWLEGKILKREHIAEVIQLSQTFKHFYSFIKDYMDNTQNPFLQVKGLDIWCGLKWWYVTWMCLHNL
jgi:hypothetical protein